MKLRLLALSLVIGAGVILAQSGNKLAKTNAYPLVTIHDIQYIDNVATTGFTDSPLLGDTVRVRGAALVRTLVDADTNRTPMLTYTTAWSIYIQDTTADARQNGWGGLNIYQSDSTYQGTFLDLVDTTDYVEVTGIVTQYGQTRELTPLTNPVTAIDFVGKLPKRPDPIQLSVTDFMNNKAEVKDAFKYSGMYVELHNLVSANRNSTNGNFNAYDANGNYIMVYQQSRYFRLDHKFPFSTFEAPADGTPIKTIRGIVSVYNDVFEITPLYPEDIYITATPPIISNIKRDKVQVNTNQSVTVSANIVDLDGTVKSASLNYKIGTANRVFVAMTKSGTDTTLYTGMIPAVTTDSTMVNFYISAKDNDGLTGYSPSDTTSSNYFYQVLDETLKIRDVQFSPYGGGYSGYNGYYVTLSGTVTADSSDIPGFGSSTPLRVYMQDGSGPWTGIMIGTKGANGTQVLNLKRGDNVTLNGVIIENYSVTSIDSLTSIVVNSNNNTLPNSVTVATGDIDKKSTGTVAAEQWESVLIDYQNVTVTDDNADGDSGPVSNNYGEIFLSDGSGDTRVELQDGNHHYENLWDAALANDPNNIQVNLGATFTELRGILYYSFGNYKLAPRKDDDFVGFVTDVKKDNGVKPITYNLSQNYPNPFNPSTIINFSIPKESIVTLKIYNILGQEVKTLVNDSKAPGSYSVSFNASSLSSGIYLYTLRAGNFFQVKKMLLLK